MAKYLENQGILLEPYELIREEGSRQIKSFKKLNDNTEYYMSHDNYNRRIFESSKGNFNPETKKKVLPPDIIIIKEAISMYNMYIEAYDNGDENKKNRLKEINGFVEIYNKVNDDKITGGKSKRNRRRKTKARKTNKRKKTNKRRKTKSKTNKRKKRTRRRR